VERGRLKIASIVAKRACPPSRIGSGIRFRMARLILIIARNIKNILIPR
jgi:hypothetical protein